MQSQDPGFEVDELELGPLRARFLALPPLQCHSGNGDPMPVAEVLFVLGLMFASGCFLGMLVAAGANELGLLEKGPQVISCAFSIGTAATAYYAWWILMMPRGSYLAVHETGFSYRCNGKHGRIRFAELRDAYSISERTKQAYKASTIANTRSIRRHLTIVSNSGESTKLANIISHIGSAQADAFFELVKTVKRSEQAAVEEKT